MIKKTFRDNSVKHAKSRKTKNRLAIKKKKRAGNRSETKILVKSLEENR